MIALKYALDVAEVQQKEIANTLGITPQQVNDWFQGRRKIPIKYHNKIESIIGLSCEILQLEINDNIKHMILENQINNLIK